MLGWDGWDRAGWVAASRAAGWDRAGLLLRWPDRPVTAIQTGGLGTVDRGLEGEAE